METRTMAEEADLSELSNSEEDRYADRSTLPVKPAEPNRMRFSSDSDDGENNPASDLTYQLSEKPQAAPAFGKSEKRRKSENFHDSLRSMEKVTYQLTDDSESTDDNDLLPTKTGLLHGINIGSTIDSREIEKTLSVYSSSHSSAKTKRQRHVKDDFSDGRQTSDSLQFFGHGSHQAHANQTQDFQSHRSARMPSSDPRTSRMDVETESIASSRQPATKFPNINRARMPENRFVRNDISDSSDAESDDETRPTQTQTRTAIRQNNVQQRDVYRATRSQESRRNDYDALFDWQPPKNNSDPTTIRPFSANKSLNSSSDSDVLKISDSSESESRAADVFCMPVRWSSSPAKLGSLKLDGVNDFDSFMKTVDKKVAGGQLEAARVGSSVRNSQQGLHSCHIEVSGSPLLLRPESLLSSIPVKKTAELSFEKSSRGKEAMPPPAVPVDHLLQSSVGMRRQKLDQIKPGQGFAPVGEANGRSRRPETSHEEKKMAEQLEVERRERGLSA
eukprot:185154-Hanusia_phi.AAC.3